MNNRLHYIDYSTVPGMTVEPVTETQLKVTIGKYDMKGIIERQVDGLVIEDLVPGEHYYLMQIDYMILLHRFIGDFDQFERLGFGIYYLLKAKYPDNTIEMLPVQCLKHENENKDSVLIMGIINDRTIYRISYGKHKSIMLVPANIS